MARLKVSTESAEEDGCAVLVTDVCDVRASGREGVRHMLTKGSVHPRSKNPKCT